MSNRPSKSCYYLTSISPALKEEWAKLHVNAKINANKPNHAQIKCGGREYLMSGSLIGFMVLYFPWGCRH
jgi:hypothetical protein